jgi:glutaredoxin
MKIIIYTVNDCPFCKQEKDYLTAGKLQFEEKNLETNKEFLTEMLAVSNNFAGTPVTKIEKDDGSIVVLKGFTKEEFDKALGLGATDKPQVAETNSQINVPKPTPVPTPPAAPQPVSPPKVEPVIPEVKPVAPPSSSESKPDELNSILNSLKEKSEDAPEKTPTGIKPPPPAVSAPVNPTPSPSQVSGALPNIPDFQAK